MSTKEILYLLAQLRFFDIKCKKKTLFKFCTFAMNMSTEYRFYTSNYYLYIYAHPLRKMVVKPFDICGPDIIHVYMYEFVSLYLRICKYVYCVKLLDTSNLDVNYQYKKEYFYHFSDKYIYVYNVILFRLCNSDIL